MATTCAASRATASTGLTRWGRSSTRSRSSSLSGAWIDGELIVDRSQRPLGLLAAAAHDGAEAPRRAAAVHLRPAVSRWRGPAGAAAVASASGDSTRRSPNCRATARLRLADQIHSDSAQLLARVCNQHLEGLVAKTHRLASTRATAPRTGSRSSATASRSSWSAAPRSSPGARHRRVFVAARGREVRQGLKYVGRVGGGFSAGERAEWHEAHRRSSREKTARSTACRRSAPVRIWHWMKPELVIQVAFADWTVRRHPAPAALSRPARRTATRRR